MAVILSHTVLSPTCAYVSYLCGAGGISWARYTAMAIPGALIWAVSYTALGYVFASQLDQLATSLSQFFGVILALCVVAGSVVLLIKRWRLHQAQDEGPDTRPT